jgi:4-oxalocrotonate tautomerase
MMPLVRIDLARGKPPGYRQAVADVIYTAMTGVLNVPNDDRFMVITEHDQADLVISPEGSQSGSHRREIPSDIG